ncbi:MAG: hypothetical protein PHU85_02945 [Phycisphaerae bacterium]|nr:hypothetical protein [Phycisphaerae bacterium]
MKMIAQIAKRQAIAAVLVIATVLLAGCPATVKPLPAPMTLDQVVAKVNANNEKLPYFKATIRTVRGEIVSDNGKRQGLDLLGLYGYLIYAQPAHLRLDLSKATTSVMGMGSNDQLYWMWGIAPYVGKCWLGSYEKWNPAVGNGVIPIHPRQLAQLLGLDAISTDFSHRPWPALRVSEPADRANILQFMAPVDDHVALMHELWVDRDTNLPRRVRVFNGHGQVVIESALRDWRKTKNGEAMFPHDVEVQSVTFKQTKTGLVPAPASRLRMTFGGADVSDRFDPAKHPLVYAFRRPPEVLLVPLDDVATSQAEPEPQP